jgi:hypothetical protein
MGYSETHRPERRTIMTEAQAAAVIFPFLFTLVFASLLMLLAVKTVKTTVRVATAPVHKIRRNRRR